MLHPPQQLFAQCSCILWFDPLNLLADDHRRDANLQARGQTVQVSIGEHDATVAGARRAAVSIRRRTVEPDAKTAASLPFVPFVGVIDRKRFATIKVGELLPRHVGRNEINTDWGFLVPFLQFLRAVLSAADIVIGKIVWLAFHVAVQIKPGFAGIGDNRVFLFRLHLQQIFGRHVLRNR